MSKEVTQQALETISSEGFSLKVLGQTYVLCPRHGKHAHTIQSSIPGHEGTWCQICWLESLGTPLPTQRDEEA